jgi:hypothetical protein
MSYKGKYRVINKHKYIGDSSNIIYRSLWERQTLKWLDNNENILAFSSEETVIPYICSTDNKMHRYYMDLTFKTQSGAVYMIEIKPNKQTKPPSINKRKSKNYLSETLAYVKNHSKWKAAQTYAEKKGWIFEIWDENKLKSLGIKILNK